MSPRSQDLRNAVRRRGIEHVMHFTQLRNLSSLVSHGFLPRNILRERTEPLGWVVDDQRMDGQDHAVSVSISAFNPKLFATKRWRQSDQHWAVLAIDPSVLWTHPCRFHVSNVLSREAQNQTGDLGHVWAFERMFQESRTYKPYGFKGDYYRKDTGIPASLTTHPDAEVQVMAPFGADLIKGIWIDQEHLADKVAQILSPLPGPAREVHVAAFNPAFSNGYFSWG